MLIHDGYITWRYWLRHVQESDGKTLTEVSGASAPSNADFKAANQGTTNGRAEEDGGNGKSRRLPCRVLMKSRGIEWFIYNRSPAYDAILQSMESQEEVDYVTASHSAQMPARRSKPDSTTSHCGSADSVLEEDLPSLTKENGEREGQDDNATADSIPRSISTDSSTHYSNPISSSLPIFLGILPVRIECNKGAIVMGNRNTRSILTAKFDSAAGQIDAGAAGALDQYKQSFDFGFSHPVIEFKHNKDYIESQLTEGAKTFATSHGSSDLKPGWFRNVDHRKPFRKILTLFRDYMPYHRGSIDSGSHPPLKSGGAQKSSDENAGAYGQNRWLGLTRYLDEDDDMVEQERWKAIEYAAFPTIVDTPELSMHIYWDVPGPVPHLRSTRGPPPRFETDINGDAPPDWVIELKVRGGTINYGPWADRQRADLQAVFFPPLNKDAVPAAKLQPGQSRVSTVLKVVLEIEEQTTLRVPTREDSKDWKWKGQTVTSNAADAKRKKRKGYGKNDKSKKVGQSPEVRPFGWLDIKVWPDSTITLAMDLMARSEGFGNYVNLDLKGVEMSSSINHGLLWRSQSQAISCNLSNPLGWNALRQWHVDIKDDGLELFMLRDHMFLMTDLINDWLSGPPGEFHTFVPFEYSVALRFNDFKLFLNANDENIINNPSDVDDNNFIVVCGQQLKADLLIPSKNFRPVRNLITLDIQVIDGGVETRTPPRNTHHTFLNGSDVAALTRLKICGSYSYFTTTSPNLTDILSLSVLGVAPRLDLYGSLVRYFMKIKDNYFGEDIHFRTLEEYQCQINISEEPTLEVPAPGLHSRLSNDLDIILDIAAQDSWALLPANLYSSERNIKLEIPSIAADLRITNYYMDLAVEFSPIAISYTPLIEPRQVGTESYSSTQIFIDGLEILGHRLFGLPPIEPTYVCNWDFDVGCVKGEFSVDFFHCLAMALRCFALSFDDAENALPPSNPLLIHDVTFLRVRVRPLSLGLQIDQTAILLSTQLVNIEYNDWACLQFSDRLHLLVPDLTLSVTDTYRESKDRCPGEAVVNTHAYVRLALELSKIERKQDFNANRCLQQNHIMMHDSRTHRVPWLVLQRDQLGASGAFTRPTNPRPPAMAFPFMPEPVPTPLKVTADNSSVMSATRSSTRASSRSISFLSTASSRRGRASRRNGDDITIHSQRRQEGDPHPLSQSVGSRSTVKNPASPEIISLLAQRGSHIKSSVKQGHIDHSGFAFSSPYKKPYFPLLAVQPATNDVPVSPRHLLFDAFVTDGTPSNTPRPGIPDQGTEQSSFMVTLGQGVQAMCTPKALLIVTQFLARFQTTDEVTLLDILQLDTITGVLNTESKRTEGARISDIRFYVPWVGARFINIENSSLNSTRCNERYDLILENLAVTARCSQQSSTIVTPPTGSQSSFHLVLDRMICSARESKGNSREDQAIISFSVRDLAGWIWYGTSLAAELQFQSFEIESTGRKIDYMSLLVQQTVVMSEDLAQRFREVQMEQKSRLQLLVLLLTSEGKDIPDPPFLTRVSNVLRSAASHPRTSDSWKMMSRLRYVHHCLPAHVLDKIHAQCVHRLASSPGDAGSRVIASFEHWRRWDLKHVRSSLLLQKVFGQSLNPPVRGLQMPVPTKGTLRAGRIKILVEPGPSQNEVTIEELIIGVALNQSSMPKGVSSTLQRSPPEMSTIQVHCAKVAVRLHWALLEFIEDLIKSMQTTQAPYQKNISSFEGVTRSSNQDACLHLAMSSDNSLVTLITTNLEIESFCRDLRISSVSLQKGASSETLLLSVLLDADATTSKIDNRFTNLTSYTLQRLRVFGSKDGTTDRSGGKRWKFACSTRTVSFFVLVNPLELIEIADNVLKDEIADIKKWVKSIQFAVPPVQPSVVTQHPVDLLQAHAALSLDSYLISLTVLPSLIYQIRGGGTRTLFKLTPRARSHTAVDLILKKHSHVFKSSIDDSSNDLSTLDMPLVNVRLSIDLGPSQRSVVLKALVESIVFDASAVHAVLDIVNRPEIVSLAENMREGASSIQNRHRQVFGVKNSPSEALPSEPILYSANVILLSLAVQTKTSAALLVGPGAQLQVVLDRIRLGITNKDGSHWTALLFPEAEIELKSIRLKLLRFDNDDVHACGDIAIGAMLRSTSEPNDRAELVRAYRIQSNSLQINLYTETASVVVAIVASLQDTLKTIDLSHEVQSMRKLGYARRQRNDRRLDPVRKDERHGVAGGAALFSSIYSLQMTNISVAWIIGSSVPVSPAREPENLILSFTKIDLSTMKGNAARLLIQDFQLQMVPNSKLSTHRSQNSALLPELVFNVAYISTEQDRRLAFQAFGKSLDLWLTSNFILPASDLRRSIALSIQQVRTATSDWNESPAIGGGQRKALFSGKRLASLLIDADFAGAAVFVQGQSLADSHALALDVPQGTRVPQHGRYNQFTPGNANSSTSTTLRAPGIAFKVEYRNGGPYDQSFNAETKIDASSNILHPTVVPLILEISSSIKDVVGDSGEQNQATRSSIPQPRFLGDERLRGADPVAIFGNCKLNLGVRICQQEFSLSCQPIARVAATARFEDIYITLNTVQSDEHGRFFTISASFTKLHASVQHVYSRESTGNFEVDSIIVSLMNSKHVSTANGISAILNVSPMKAQVNARQSQDFLLFRDIWVPPEIRRSSTAATPVLPSESQTFIVQRYQQIASAGAFPWNATVSVAELDVQLDLGQSLGRSALNITSFWISSKKTSNWEQNLCIGFKKMAINSSGRMSGFVKLQKLKVRTSIQWPMMSKAHHQTPLVQASLAFDDLRVKASFDYQAFFIADINMFGFLMYNIRDLQKIGRDRLVGVLEGEKVQVYCTTTSASQAIALYQAFLRLYQEKLTAYKASLRDVEKFLRRRSSITPLAIRAAVGGQGEPIAEMNQPLLRLQTNVVVTLKSVNIGAFPSTFLDSQILKLEAFDASARFAVVLEHKKIHSTLGMTLGQLRVALASVTRSNVPKTLGEVSMVEVVASATNSRGGTILKVPKLIASMETWQNPESTHIDYIFKSSFQGKVDVGWNYSRISYIRGMWTSHAHSLAQRLGKPLPKSAVQITGGARLKTEDKGPRRGEGEQEKITAVVNVPQSKYQYSALQPAIIETPQLRDMGEATPPLEWIGLHRERLPNLTHQIIIVTLLEVAKEVDDAYSKILGSS